jgi:hypothetical protein
MRKSSWTLVYSTFKVFFTTVPVHMQPCIQFTKFNMQCIIRVSFRKKTFGGESGRGSFTHLVPSLGGGGDKDETLTM